MKYTFCILAFLILISCRESNSKYKATVTSENHGLINKGTGHDIAFSEQELLNLNFEKATLYKLADTISADFNGDGFLDKAVFNKENGTSGIIIIHGQTNEEIRIGFGKNIAHLTEFDWVDYWGLVEDNETSETTFSEDGEVFGVKDIKLENPSILVEAEELGGGLITFINGN